MAASFNAPYMMAATGLTGLTALVALTGLMALTGFAAPHKKQAPGLPGACFNRDQQAWKL